MILQRINSRDKGEKILFIYSYLNVLINHLLSLSKQL